MSQKGGGAEPFKNNEEMTDHTKTKIIMTLILFLVVPICILFLYNNTPSNPIVNAASSISYRPLIQTDVFAALFMNLTNVVI
jgi:hypothetical protein